MNPEVYLIIAILSCFAAALASWVVNSSRIKAEVSLAIRQDITSDQMRMAEERVSRFLSDNNLRAGADISQIGEKLKIRVSDREKQLPGQAHLSGPDEQGVMTVTFRRGLSYQEQKFAFAHECGHIINGDTAPIDRPDGKHKANAEQEADYVAAALLMPLDQVYDYLAENHYPDASVRKRMKVLRGLRRIFGVDSVIAMRRIQEIYTLREMCPE